MAISISKLTTLLVSGDRVLNVHYSVYGYMVNLNHRNESDFVKIITKAKVKIESSANLMGLEADRPMHGVCFHEPVLAASLFNVDRPTASLYFSLSPYRKT